MHPSALQLVDEARFELLGPSLERHMELVDPLESFEEAVVEYRKVGERLGRFRRLALRDKLSATDPKHATHAEAHLVGPGHLVDGLVDGQEERVTLVELVAVLVLRARDGALVVRELRLDVAETVASRSQFLLRVAEGLPRKKRQSGEYPSKKVQHLAPWRSRRACLKGRCAPA